MALPAMTANFETKRRKVISPGRKARGSTAKGGWIPPAIPNPKYLYLFASHPVDQGKWRSCDSERTHARFRMYDGT